MKIENPEEALSHIRQHMQHPGWVLLCARHAIGVQDLTDAILDARTPNEVATNLRHTRAAVLELSPAKLAEGLSAKLAAAVKKAAPEPT